jgi:hypothetical protein
MDIQAQILFSARKAAMASRELSFSSYSKQTIGTKVETLFEVWSNKLRSSIIRKNVNQNRLVTCTIQDMKYEYKKSNASVQTRRVM